MLKLVEFFILLQLQYIVVKCFIPDLSVRKFDRKVIDKKRQDTLDMCRIFNEENEKMKYYSASDTRAPQHKRFKRNLPFNPALNVEEKKRMDTIIDQLYEDIDVKTTKKEIRQPIEGSIKNKTSRRFNFAPAELLGPLSKEDSTKSLEKPEEYAGKSARFPLGIVPYFIDPKTYDSQLSEIIVAAFDYFEKATCVRLQKLRERPTDSESLKKVLWLYITNPSGIRQCVHSNERHQQDGVQMIVFGYDCMSLGDIIHEVMHILGFSHEHTRTDRDQYVTILWENIKPGYKKYFETYDKNILESLPYDYASVLHYPPRAFSKNGQITIMTPPGAKIGQRDGLSETDIEKIGALFSSECLKRNKDYLLKTCPSVVRVNKMKLENANKVNDTDVEKYFANRLWPYGIVSLKIDKTEFTLEERDNINAVIRHIEKETCITFRDLTDETEKHESDTEHEQHEFTTDPVEIKTTIEYATEDSSDGNWSSNANATSPDTDSSSTADLKIDDEAIKNEISDAVDQLNWKSESSPGLPDPYNPNRGENSMPAVRTEANQSDTKFKSIKTGTNIVSAVTTKRTTRAAPITETRRHANSILVLKRSAEPGCLCPEPGKPDGNKVLHINADCFNSVNDLLHLFVHVLGLDHQHNMHDRDSFLHIVWDNLTDDVREEMREKLPPAASVGFAYDYQSVMHYPWLQIKNGTTNIMYPIWNDGWEMGHWNGLSLTDVKKLNILYNKQCHTRNMMDVY